MRFRRPDSHWFRVDGRPFRVKKSNKNIRICMDWALDRQNNNFARAAHFLMHFFVVTARPRPHAAFYGGRKHTTKNFSFSFLTGVGSPIINSMHENSLTFNILSEMKQKRNCLKKKCEFIFNADVLFIIIFCHRCRRA